MERDARRVTDATLAGRRRGDVVGSVKQPPSVPAAPAEVPLAAKVAWLADAAGYGNATQQVEVIETHFAYVFLAGTFAYKLKKPVEAYGADYRTLAGRERYCREELRLNARVAPQTYLRVVPLTSSDGRLALAGHGAVIDWLVEMRRLDRRQMLDARLRADTVAPADLEAVVARLHSLDRAEPAGHPPSGSAECQAPIARRLDEALHTFARPEMGLPSRAYAPLALALRARYAQLHPVFAARSWRVREGHGDLRAEHVWLGRPVQIIDALEFDRELRMLDPAEDLAMLAVDVERQGGGWIPDVLRKAYERRADDRVPDLLWRFYLSLRAATRAKVALWHLDDTGSRNPGRWREQAQAYLALGERYIGDC